MITLIDNALLDELCAAAAAHPRRRKNRNFHPRDDHPAHRLLNAMQPDSYIPPHRHLDPPKAEAWILLRGAVAFFTFEDDGRVRECLRLSAGSDHFGIDLVPGDEWTRTTFSRSWSSRSRSRHRGTWYVASM